MGRFYGKVGYGETVEIAPGAWDDVIVEKSYYGDVTRLSKDQRDADKVNNDLRINNAFSLMADAYAYENYYNIRYIIWGGIYWDVTTVETIRPRLLVNIGGVYDGPKAPAPDDSQ